MPTNPLDRIAREVLARARSVAPDPARLVPAPAGFSGARVWRVDLQPGGCLCLRAWPAGTRPGQVAIVHRLMARARGIGLDFVPRPLYLDTEPTDDQAGPVWELQEWMPGRADFHERPTSVRLRAVGTALARLHRAWEGAEGTATITMVGPCPGVLRRLAVVDQWRALTAGGWNPLDVISPEDPLRPVAERALRDLPWRIDRAAHQLRAACISRSRQPCLCDPWHDHYLFEGDRLTGLIDYGAVQVDHPAVDVARTLGSLVEDDDEGWQTGLAAYRAVRSFSLDDEVLARLLDRTGVVLSVAKWLLRLFDAREAVADRRALARRLERMVSRLKG